MSVYVDAMAACVPNPNWKWSESCHMFADTLDELHRMADRIGLKRAWFQNKQKLPHYDLTRARRAEAVKFGAIEVDREFVGSFMRNRQAANPVRDQPAPGMLFGGGGRML